MLEMILETPVLVAFISGVIGPILVMVAKERLEKSKKKPDMVVDTLAVSEKISKKLDDIKDEFKADRVWLSQFHNGGHFYPTGKSIAKFSMVYETVELNVKSIQTSYQNIPVSLFSKSINHLLEHDVIEINDFKDETIATYGLKYVAEEAGTKSTYLFAIKTFEGKFIGCIAIDYTKKKVKLSQDDIYHLQNKATAIGGVLITHLNSK
jgi:hypothetical protein